MKGRRASWSIDGANNMARLLAASENNELENMIDTLDSDLLADYLTEKEKHWILSKHGVEDAPRPAFTEWTVPPMRNWKKDAYTDNVLRYCENYFPN